MSSLLSKYTLASLILLVVILKAEKTLIISLSAIEQQIKTN
jgi:hypothetical protein